MIKRVELITVADEPNINNVIYTTELMKQIESRLNNYKYVPIVVLLDSDEYSSSVGRVIPNTAIFDGKKITVDIDIDEHWIDLIDSKRYFIGSRIIADLVGNLVVANEKFDVLELQIFKMGKRYTMEDK